MGLLHFGEIWHGSERQRTGALWSSLQSVLELVGLGFFFFFFFFFLGIYVFLFFIELKIISGSQ